MSKTIFAGVVTVLAVALGTSPVDGASIISINHISAAGGNGTLAPADVGGVVPAANWNNFAAYPDQAVRAVNYAPSSLLFDDGTPSGATAQMSSTSGYTQDNGYAPTSGHSKLMRGATNFFGADNAVLTIANLPMTLATGGYDVYVYADSNQNDRNAAITLNGSTTLKTTDNTTFPLSGFDDGTTDQSGNYVKFSGVTGTGFNLSLSRDGTTGGRPGYTGFQIVGLDGPGLTPGPIAFIDVNDARGVPTGPDTNGNYWNSTATETDTVALVDTSNVPTGWTLATQESPVGGDTGLSGGLDNPVAPPAPYNIRQAYADSWYDNNSGGGKGEFSFSGLDSSSEYELKLFGARSGGVLGNIAFTAGSAAPFALESGSMLTVTATPDASGVITFLFNKGIPGTGSTADLNLMSIQEFQVTQDTVVPEPASFLTWALGLLGLIGWWRRRTN